MTWRQWKKQHSQPKTLLTEPQWWETSDGRIDEFMEADAAFYGYLQKPSIYQVIRRYCYQAIEAALEAGRTEPVLLVSRSVWNEMMTSPEIRGDLRFTYWPETVRWGEKCVLYGVHICVLPESERYVASDGSVWVPGEGRFWERVSAFTGETYDPEWGVRWP